MSWWTSEPVAYTKSDYEGHRIRYLIAEKRARIATRIDMFEEFPESLQEVNPDGIYPILTDKNLVCYGSALEELIHERYPSPTLLPIDPVKRAQVRMLANKVRGHYNLGNVESFLAEVEETYNSHNSLFIIGHLISVVDVALAPLIYDATQLGTFVPSGSFKNYTDRLMARPAFAQSLRPSTPVSPEEELNEEAA